MRSHAAARADALPHRRQHPHHVRSGAGPSPGDRRRPLEREERPGQRPGPLQRILVGLRVLVVDDDIDVLELFSVALTACGAEVTTTDNARDAIALATRMRPHVIVSDIAMVGEDGYWLVRELKRLPAEMLDDIPVVAATAYGREHPRARVLAAGFVEHLQKPVDPEQLCQVVARVARR
jgi:CheY-like chemotaxis protein